MKKAILALADGRIFAGRSFGAEGETTGEVVFNTSMAGYQEVLTDPSYKGQIVTMTCPLIGNYGVNDEDIESPGPVVEGFIVKEACRFPSNWRSQKGIDQYLRDNGIVGIEGIDTRALTVHIRKHGAQQGVISTEDLDQDSLINKARSAPGMVGRDLVKLVTCPDSYKWEEGRWGLGTGYRKQEKVSAEKAPRFLVVAYDFGIKRNILRLLVDAGCDVMVVPAHTSYEQVLDLNPDGIFLSNGPGDPEGVGYAIKNITEFVGKRPVFGICLGHQLLALALGGKTYKLKFGHRGGNQPVMDLTTKKVEITTQNHGFAVDIDSIGGNMELTHINLNDNTVEGMRHKSLPLFSVQYHPESSPGPHDSRYLFDSFVTMMRDYRKGRG
ncbi:MAG: glutamine-hydrolyzing carbamoyl-phosphate synthase small subunit [Nitrospirae bacterium]|nr:glutamine-hydrolyzing carbamoyl-phosphate synthase small subunit [Nitrospirota bacterium]